MTGRAASGEFTRWADELLAGSGWTLATVRGAVEHASGDLAGAALADGFAAAARGLALSSDGADGAA